MDFNARFYDLSQETAQEAGREEYDKRRSQNGTVGRSAKAKGW